MCSAFSTSYPNFHFLKWKSAKNVSNGSEPYEFIDFGKSKFEEIRETAKPHIGNRQVYTHHLVIRNVTSADEAKYTCVVGSTAGWVSEHAFLAVLKKGMYTSLQRTIWGHLINYWDYFFLAMYTLLLFCL